MIVAGVSCYSRALDYRRFREIADEVGAYLFSDMAHISGLVAAGVTPSPFEYSDIVSTTTHKSLRGPRAGVIFFRKGVRSVNAKGEKTMYDLESRVNQAVFPGLQGGPHNNTIAGIATTMLQAKTPEFVEYQKQIVKNARRLASGLMEKGYKISTGGTDVHMLLVDLRNTGVSGAKAEYVLEEISIACNKNTVPGDKSALNPSGFRLGKKKWSSVFFSLSFSKTYFVTFLVDAGTPAITTRGLVESDIDRVVDFIDRAIKIAKEVSVKSGPKLVDFKRLLHEDAAFSSKIAALREEVETFSLKFPLPGLPDY